MNETTPLRRSLFLGVWLIWMGIVFYFSTQTWGGAETQSSLDRLLTLYVPSVREMLSTSDLGHLNFAIRKLAHFTEYAILTFLGYWAWSKSLGRAPQQAIRIALAISILFAISDEFHQLFVPGRTSLYTDVLIDCLGASLLALTLQQWIARTAIAKA
ncbi:VanZ family protein [Altericista sp. CCNU0014]|uniref:VanZ family protein n=1 Tax=Altericista sp. CCNU0014 TaxID=3082949 RepID=UPI00384FC01A